MTLHRLVPSTARFDSSRIYTLTSPVVTSEVFPPPPPDPPPPDPPTAPRAAPGLSLSLRLGL